VRVAYPALARSVGELKTHDVHLIADLGCHGPDLLGHLDEPLMLRRDDAYALDLAAAICGRPCAVALLLHEPCCDLGGLPAPGVLGLGLTFGQRLRGLSGLQR
jgi:hypothetical protein